MTVRVKLNLRGFREFRTHPLAQAAVLARLQRIAAAANAASGGGYVADMSTTAKQRARGVVRPDTPAAAADSSRNLTLLKSLDAGRG